MGHLALTNSVSDIKKDAGRIEEGNREYTIMKFSKMIPVPSRSIRLIATTQSEKAN